MAALLYLKHAYNESNESLVERWAQGVYFQFFSGQDCFVPRLPCDATQIGRFRAAIGEAGVEELLKATIDTAVTTKVTRLVEFERVRTQITKDKNKRYAMHAPEVECLAKVRREVANIIVSPAHKVGDETGRSVGRSLPVHALPATATCEATGTTCRAFGPRRRPRGNGVTCQRRGGWDARLSGMVNRCELLQASLDTTSQRC